MFFSLLALVLLGSLSVQGQLYNVPQQQKLLAYWPLGRDGYRDLGPNQFPWRLKGDVLETAVPESITGPFGDPATFSKCGSCEMCYLADDPRFSFADTSFTIAFFVYIDGKPNGGLFRTDWINGLQMYYMNDTYVYLMGMDKQKIFGVKMLQPDTWNFIALTFDDLSGRLALYGLHGLVYQQKSAPQVYHALSYQAHYEFGIGRILDWNSHNWYANQASFSCVSVHKTELTDVEVDQLIQTCRAVHKSTPSGQPRVAQMSSLPRSSSAGVSTNAGRFPWMVSIRSSTDPSKHKCTASIFSDYYLITSTGCADGAGTAIVGEYDTAETEPFEAIHKIKKVSFYPDYEYDIAILHLVTPISMANKHVNNLELRKREEETAKEFFHAGWSAESDSTTVPRYSFGKVLSQSECANAWQKIKRGEAYPDKGYICMKPTNNKGVPGKNGDQGAALLGSVTLGYTPDKHLVMFGVFAIRGEDESEPAFYADVLPAVNWIKSVVACPIPKIDYYPAKCPQNRTA